MGKKHRNKKKMIQLQEYHPVLDTRRRRRNTLDPQPSQRPDRDDDHKIEEKSGDDFFSKLPDDVLQHIISLLPLRDAVTTGFLSTRWRHLWEAGLETWETDHGTVHEIFREIRAFLHDFLDVFLLLPSSTGQEFIPSLLKFCRRLRFDFGHHGFLLATITPNGTLHLDFHSNKHEFPTGFDLQWTATYDSMWLWSPFDDDDAPVYPYKFVRSLHLISVTILTSEAVSSVLSEFRYLESLIIRNCHGLHSLRIKAGYYFSKLMIFNCLRLKSLHIQSDKIDKFRFRGLLPRFSSEGISSYVNSCCLVDAMLDFRGGPGYDHFKYPHSDSLLSAIGSSRILTLCRWTFEHAMMRRQTRPTCERPPTIKFHLLQELQWMDNEVDEDSVDSLIFFLKKCPPLQKLYINIEPTSYRRPSTRKWYSDEEDIHNEWERLVYLEIVQIEGVREECDRKLLVNRLLDVVGKKTKIIAKSHENRVWKLEEVSLSPLLEEGMKHYMFVQVNEEESGKLCSKHSHAHL